MQSSDPQLPLAPPPFRLTSSNVAEMRQGGGWLSLFGVPFLLAGVLLLVKVVPVLPRAVASKTWVVLVFASLSVIFIGLGGVLLFGRRWVRLDISTGSLLRSTGLLIPMRSEHRHLSEFEAVVIAFEGGDSDRSDH